jgi:hypothetical protein
MDEALKELSGKNISKKGLFDFLSEINLDALSGVTDKVSFKNIIVEPSVNGENENKDESIQCMACMKFFTSLFSLKRHQTKNPECVKLLSLPDRSIVDKYNLSKGLHLIIHDVLEKAISTDKLQCKFCNSRFTTTGNHHKHYNSSKICNMLAFLEFKTLINEI